MQYLTKPHGQHTVVLTEDRQEPGMRLYEVRDNFDANLIGWTGEELDDLATWWATEKARGVQKQVGATSTNGREVACRCLELRLSVQANKPGIVVVTTVMDQSPLGQRVRAAWAMLRGQPLAIEVDVPRAMLHDWAHITSLGDSPADAGVVRRSLAALYARHACEASCRTCDYAYNALAGDQDNGDGVLSLDEAMANVFGTPAGAAE